MNTDMFTYPCGSEPMRLDLFISSQLEGETRAAVQRLIETGNILVDGHPARASLKLKGGEQVYGRDTGAHGGGTASGINPAGSALRGP